MSKHTELVIALVGGTGTNFDQICAYIKGILSNYFLVHDIRISTLPHKYFKEPTSDTHSELERILYHQDLCDKYAKTNSAIMSILAMMEIAKKRKPNKSNAYIINSLKRENEFKALRRVYGNNLILISVYESKERRMEHLINREIIETSPFNKPDEDIKKKTKEIIDRDKQDGVL